MTQLVRYKIPIIGHTYSYLYDCKDFFKLIRKEYGGIFSLCRWGQVRIFVGRKEHMHEVLARDDVFDFEIVIKRNIPGDVMFVNGLGDFKYNAAFVKNYITKN
ncbi:10916_t:CDS:2 [Funneliformis geosporum]|uniref:10916_t:CDS:1 n=1 Tax=Funneliformis geosporum TaxID=1117311 RepID=A0A9W4T443_9GLOM|nr:10916_t:CDS:2 [Funneliformis geosporum]